MSSQHEKPKEKPKEKPLSTRLSELFQQSSTRNSSEGIFGTRE
jgi:hypothetical protein